MLPGQSWASASSDLAKHSSVPLGDAYITRMPLGLLSAGRYPAFAPHFASVKAVSDPFPYLNFMAPCELSLSASSRKKMRHQRATPPTLKHLVPDRGQELGIWLGAAGAPSATLALRTLP